VRGTGLGPCNVGYFCQPFNLTGQPAASIPCGLTPDNLPVGLQVVAPPGGEATLISEKRRETIYWKMTILSWSKKRRRTSILLLSFEPRQEQRADGAVGVKGAT
jgi:hypothetical protein